MTLIVFNKGVLASDSLETAGGKVVTQRSKKIYKHKHYVLAACGSSSTCAWFYEWLKSNFMKAPLTNSDEYSEAILIDREKKKVYRVYASGTKEELDPKQPVTLGCADIEGMILVKEFKMKPRDVIKMVAKYDTAVNARVQQVKCW